MHASRPAPTPWPVVRLLRCLHLFPSLLVTGVTLALARIVDPEAPAIRYMGLGGAMLLFQFAIGLFNDVTDLEDDRRAGRPKPLVLLDIPGHQVRTLAGAGVGLLSLGGLFVMAATLPARAWGAGVAGLACGLIYDRWLQHTRWAWAPYAVAIPLIPVWVVAASGFPMGRVWWLLPLGALIGVALHLANQAPDARHDRGAVGRLGAPRARALAVAGFVLAAGIAAAALVALEAHPLAVAVSVASIIPALALRRSDVLFKCMAVSAVAVAVSVVASIPR